MANVVVVGAQWGDEGKAKITDLLAEDADIIIRYQGGCNAGHTVVVNGETYKFHLIPSGILYNKKTCIIGAGTVIYPVNLAEEIQGLKDRGIDPKNLRISPLAHVTMPYHIDIDGYSENNLGSNKIGTTKKGIGPTYTDKNARLGIRIEDLYDEETLNNKINVILPIKNRELESVFGMKTYSKEEILEYCHKYADILKPYVCENLELLLRDAQKRNRRILFEGAQGVMLDVDCGTYPYVTSSNPVAGGAFTGSGYGPNMAEEIVGVSKAYITRVGEGPFLTELEDETGKRIQDIGHEFGTTTGRARRCGWFDAIVARYGVLTSGLTSMAVTKLDVFDDFDEIKVCTAYKDKRDGKIYDYYPTNVTVHKYLEPVYETHDGWKQDITAIKDYNELPKNARKYLKRLEVLIEIPVSIVSTGPDREQTIMLENPILK